MTQQQRQLVSGQYILRSHRNRKCSVCKQAIRWGERYVSIWEETRSCSIKTRAHCLQCAGVE